MSTRSAAIAAVLVICAAGGGFGASRLLDGPPPAQVAAVGPTTARSAPEDVAAARGRVPHPPADALLAEVRGAYPGTRLGLLSLRRAGGTVMVVAVRLTATRNASQSNLDDLGLQLSGLDLDSVSAMELRDAATGRAAVPSTDSAAGCDCSSFGGLRPGRSADLGATFRMPTAEGPFVLRVPGFPEIAGIEPAAEPG